MAVTFSAKRDKLHEPTPAERDIIVERARRLLQSSVDSFIETGELPSWASTGGGTVGDLRDAREDWHDRKGHYLYRPSERELIATRAWHDYCREHGYPVGERAGMTEGYPSSPSVEDVRGTGVWTGLTWPTIRRELREGRAPEQMTFDFEVAA